MVICMVDSSAPTTMTMAVLQEPPDKLRHMNASAAGESSRAPWRTGAIPELNVDVDISEVYFLIMHFLSSGPCQRAFVHLSNEILQHKLLPRRYHAVFSREGVDKKEDGMSFPLTYQDILSRNPTLEQDHLVKLLQQLLLQNRVLLGGLELPHARLPTAADVPTLLGTGNFSLIDSARSNVCKDVSGFTQQLRWPHWHADQVHGLMLRQLGGGFARHHQAPSVRTPSYVIVKPAVLVDRIQIIKKLRGHRNAVYCAVFDGTGQYVITGSDDRLVKFWSAETGLCLRSCRGHEGDITDLAVSNRNKYVASASNDFCIRIWLLPSGVPVSVLRGHTASVTAIAFSPRQGCEHLLLSSSDDGTCRIWDASDSTLHSRVYMPNPKDVNPAPKPTAPAAPSTVPGCNQIFCCAFNADGSIFVTGSSDKIARVWDACKWNDDVTGRPNYEMDTLKGHENDVNYVQFSGCAAPRKPLSSDTIKDEHSARFRNSWFSHDSIVTCSRDGTAIIWMLQSLKPNVKVGRWQKAYHLRVPPPPMPPLPPRGNGPRQRLLPTPRGVNMIVWSLDNRFVLAAIMDHRICVWNAADGSLVHSLTGHDKPTYVLDVHPLNPRIAMSAGYDGRVIIWDIWEGCPIKVYETGEYTLVDGNFSPDGTSLVVSDEVGQVYIFGTGSKMSEKDVKYDQFFLGDFRPLARDTHGNVLDVETQLTPHNRNLRDLLCDAGMIPYPEPYQTIYQQRRLAYLGYEWQPPTQMLSIGTHDDVTYFPPEQPTAFLPPVPPSPERHDRQGAVNGDRNRWVEQPPEVEEAMDWEQEVVGLSEDTGSDYSASDESLSEEKEMDGYESLSEEESNSEEEGVEATVRLRRSGRNKRKKEAGRTASRRRVRGRTCNDHESSKHRPPRGRQSKVSRNGLGRAGRPNMVSSQEPTSSRPKRQAARNALTLFDSFRNPPPDEDEDDDSEEECKIVVLERRSGRAEREVTAAIEEPRPQLRSLRKSLQEDGEEDDDRPNFQNKASTSQPEADSVGDCRRPRSQRPRKIVFKFRNPSGASNSPTIQADRPALSVGISDEPPLVASTSETPHAPEQSQKSFRKLIIKPPKRIDQGSGDEEDEDSESVLPVMTRGSAKLSTALSESGEEGLSHDEKKQQWVGKKGKAVSVAGAGGSSLSKSEQKNNFFEEGTNINHEIVSDLNLEDEPQQSDHLKLAEKGGTAQNFLHRCANNKQKVELDPEAARLQQLDRQVNCTGEPSSHLSMHIDCSDKLLGTEAGRDISHLEEAERHIPSTSTSGRATNGDSSHKPKPESRMFLKGEEVNKTRSFDLEHECTLFNDREQAAEVKISREYIPHDDDDDGDEYGLNHEEDEQEMLQKEGLETDRDHVRFPKPCPSIRSQVLECEDEKSHSEGSEDVQGYTEVSGDERVNRGKVRMQRHERKIPAEVSSDLMENSLAARHVDSAVDGQPWGDVHTADEDTAGTSRSASHLKGQVLKSRKRPKGHKQQESDSPKNRSARIRRCVPSDSAHNSGSLVERPLRITVKCPETTVKHQDEYHQDGNAGGRGKQTRSASIAAQQQQQKRQDLIQKEKTKVVEVKVGVSHSALRGGWRASKQRPRVINNAWLLMSEVEAGTHYTPQFGDEVAYLQQGHKEFLKKSRNERGPWTKYRLGPVEFCRIIGLNYSIDTGLGSTSCMIQLEFTDASSQAYRQSFTLTLPELTDHPDFIVEKSRYDASMAKGWVPRDHCKVWWANGVDYKGQWWDGRIKSIKLKSDSFPGSPWEKYLVSYKGAPEPTAHSPWELFDKYCQIPGWSVPQIDEKLKEDLLNAVCSVEDTLYDDEDEYGVKELMSLVTDDPNFLNEVPVPLTLDRIRERLQKDYYRSDEAVEHDVRLLVTNVELFCGPNHKLVSKMERLVAFILASLQ